MRGEGEKGVAIPAIRCNVWVKRWAVKSGVLEKQCVWICGSDDHKKVITTKERTKRTLKSSNTSLNIRLILSFVHHAIAACV